MIEVRTSETTFAPSDVRRYISRASLDGRVAWPEVALFGYGKPRKLTFDDSSYLLAVLSPDFARTSDGLFLRGAPPHGVVDSKYVMEHGRFASEGLNNHVHLHGFTKSRVAQFEIGVRAIRQWIYVISAMPDRPRHVVLYLNGSTEFTICAYSEPSASELDELERGLGGKIVSRTAELFLAWAFPVPDQVVA